MGPLSVVPPSRPSIGRFWKKSFKPEFPGKEWKKTGDIEAALKSGTRVEAEDRAPYVAHQPLEPLNGTAILTDKGMEIWVSHQSPQAVQSIAATGDRPTSRPGHVSQSMDRWKLRTPP